MKQKWSELDYIAGAAHEMHMSYGKYVAQGMPNLQRFKRRVESGEFDQKRREHSRKGTLQVLATMDGGSAKAKRKEPLKIERMNLICKRCGSTFDAASNCGPMPTYCPECRVIRQVEQRRIDQKAYRQRKKAGAILA